LARFAVRTNTAFAGWQLYPRSVIKVGATTYYLVRHIEGKAPAWGAGMGKVPAAFAAKALAVMGDTAPFDGEPQGPGLGGREGVALLCPLSAANAAALRARLPWLTPQPLGLSTSAGCGDRLGLATPVTCAPSGPWAARSRPPKPGKSRPPKPGLLRSGPSSRCVKTPARVGRPNR